MQAISDKHQDLIWKRQNLMTENFASLESTEQEEHWVHQLTDTEQMIGETTIQIKEIQEQIAKITNALEQR